MLRALINNNLDPDQRLLESNFVVKDRKNQGKNLHNFTRGSKKNTLSGEELRKSLERVCEGLTFESETDADIEPFFFPTENRRLEDAVIETFKLPEKSYKQVDASYFFSRLTVDRPWHSEEEISRRKAFREIEELLSNNLDRLTCLRFGSVRVRIFVAGLDREGNAVGITTLSVET